MNRTINGRMSRHGDFAGLRREPTFFGPKRPAEFATREAAEECDKLLLTPTLPSDVRAAATAIVRSYEHKLKLNPDNIRIVLAYMQREREQNRYGQ